jgi:hypothetical protein
MTIGTRVDSTSGPVSSNSAAGLSVARDTSNRGFAPYRVDALKACTAGTTLVAGDAGVTTMSGSGGVITVVLPTAASCPGAEFVLRNLDARAHVVTSSGETAGSTVIVSGALVGAKLTMAAVVGASAVLKSDGVHFTVVGGFGANAVS